MGHRLPRAERRGRRPRVAGPGSVAFDGPLASRPLAGRPSVPTRTAVGGPRGGNAVEVEPAAPADRPGAHCPMALTQRLPIGNRRHPPQQQSTAEEVSTVGPAGEAGPPKAAETGSRHVPGQLGRARPGVPVLHPVAAAPWRSHPGAGLGRTATIGTGCDVVAAWIWRAFAEGTPSALSWAWPGLPGECRGAAGGLLRAGQYSYESGASWGCRLQPRTGRGISRGRSRSLRPAHSHRPRPSTRLPVGRTAAEGWIGPRAAAAVGWALVVGLTYLVRHRLQLDGFVRRHKAFSVHDTTTPEGCTSRRPTCAPAAPAPWCRGLPRLPGTGHFTGLGPSPDRHLEKVTHHPGSGAKSGPTPAWRPAPTRSPEPPRGPGFPVSRRIPVQNLLVVTTTAVGGRPRHGGTFEYLTHGEAATVAIQYSYLPSWISYLVDQPRPEAGRTLFYAVYDRGRAPGRPAPKALRRRREPRLLRRTRPPSAASTTCATAPTGMLFAGPPNFNTLFREFSHDPAPGARRSSPSTRTGEPSGSPTMPGAFPRRAARGKAAASST